MINYLLFYDDKIRGSSLHYKSGTKPLSPPPLFSHSLPLFFKPLPKIQLWVWEVLSAPQRVKTPEGFGDFVLTLAYFLIGFDNIFNYNEIKILKAKEVAKFVSNAGSQATT